MPKHWPAVFTEIRNELAKVTNKVYEGQVSKGAYNGIGQLVYPNGDVYKGAYKMDCAVAQAFACLALTVPFIKVSGVMTNPWAMGFCSLFQTRLSRVASMDTESWMAR